MIQIAPTIAIDEREIEEQFVRASGPGGQNVNKVATAVQLRYDVDRSATLPDGVRARLKRLAGRRLTAGGILIIDARRFRTQARNRQDALERLIELLRRAAVAPTQRKKTRPTAVSREKRLQGKRRRGEIKRLRGSVPTGRDA